jgi:hypothetical protein
MEKSYAFEFVDEILDVAGLNRTELIEDALGSRGTSIPTRLAEELKEIETMPSQKFQDLILELSERSSNYYSRNFGSVLEKLAGVKDRSKAYYFGGFTPLTSKQDIVPDWFFRKAGLFYEEIIVEDELRKSLTLRRVLQEEFLRTMIADSLLAFMIYRPYMERGIVELVLNPLDSRYVQGTADVISSIGDLDYRTESSDLKSPYLEYEDLNLEGSALIQYLTEQYDQQLTREATQRKGGSATIGQRMMIEGDSNILGSAFFGSSFTDSHPATDLLRYHRLFGYWTAKRAQEHPKSIPSMGILNDMMTRARIGKCWMEFEPLELKVLSDLPVNEFLEARDSSELSLDTFRNKLDEDVREMERQNPEDKDYEKVVRHIWKETLEQSQKVSSDLDKYKKRLAVDVITSLVKMSFGLMNLNLQELAKELLEGIKDVQQYRVDVDEARRSSGYFLVKLEKTAEELEARKRLREKGIY